MDSAYAILWRESTTLWAFVASGCDILCRFEAFDAFCGLGMEAVECLWVLEYFSAHGTSNDVFHFAKYTRFGHFVECVKG